jgi:hypothetical protein
MRCITVYTNNYQQFLDSYELICQTPLLENEEKEVDGLTISDSGEIPQDYIIRMKEKPEVAVLKDVKHKYTILQHGKVFEILIP